MPMVRNVATAMMIPVKYIIACKGTNKREENQKNFEFSRARVLSTEGQSYKKMSETPNYSWYFAH